MYIEINNSKIAVAKKIKFRNRERQFRSTQIRIIMLWQKSYRTRFTELCLCLKEEYIDYTVPEKGNPER